LFKPPGCRHRVRNDQKLPARDHLNGFCFPNCRHLGMLTDLLLFCWIFVALLTAATLLHLLPRLGRAGKRLSDACCRAPLLDVIVCYFTILPLVVGALVAGWRGLIGGGLAQLVTLLAWQTIHEAIHRESARGPRIIKVLNKKFGALRNLTAVYVTGFAIPVFWFIRMAELILYPPLVKLVHLPPYHSADWISVSRQKFSGLVGHDLIWCLYCDWMTGVWSLGTEMLRNVESFWCPIRFSCEKKCANCAIDFPDVNQGWVDASGNMSDVVRTLERMYPSANEPQAWFGHPIRQENRASSTAPSSTKPAEASAK
jgi:hypothetical protein